MRGYLNTCLFKSGAVIALIGWSPLLAAFFVASIGLWSDPNSNPIGFGLLFFLSFWPAGIFMAIGAFQIWRRGDSH